MLNQKIGIALVLALTATPALAQDNTAKEREADRAGQAVPGDSARADGPGTEYHEGEKDAAGEVEPDPTHHFNFIGIQPGHLFDYIGKDEFGGPMGDRQETDTKTGQVLHEEEPASPPFIFMLINFAILLGLLAWKGKPAAQQAAAERHDLIKSALDEAAKLRKQAADKLAEYETRLKDADAEIKKMVEGMRADAEADKQRMLAAAEAQAAMMKRDAESRIAAEIELARATLTREVTAAAAAATEKLLRDKMTAGDQQNLVSAFITDVSRAPAAGTSKGTVR